MLAIDTSNDVIILWEFSGIAQCINKIEWLQSNDAVVLSKNSSFSNIMNIILLKTMSTSFFFSVTYSLLACCFGRLIWWIPVIFVIWVNETYGCLHFHLWFLHFCHSVSNLMRSFSHLSNSIAAILSNDRTVLQFLCSINIYLTLVLLSLLLNRWSFRI